METKDDSVGRNAKSKGRIENYFLKLNTRRKTNVFPPTNGTDLGWSNGRSRDRVVEVKSTRRKMTSKAFSTGMVKKTVSKGAKSRTWEQQFKRKLTRNQEILFQENGDNWSGYWHWKGEFPWD